MNVEYVIKNIITRNILWNFDFFFFTYIHNGDRESSSAYLKRLKINKLVYKIINGHIFCLRKGQNKLYNFDIKSPLNNIFGKNCK